MRLNPPFTHKYFSLLFLLTLLGSTDASAQPQEVLISGQILDSQTSSPVEYATVAVLLSRDSSVLTGGVTDANGKFEIMVKRPGRFLLQVQSLAYQTLIKPVMTRESTNVGTLKLVPSDLQLDEVVVQGERTQVHLELDKRVYTVGKDLSSLGGSASDILDNLPSVSVDVEGNVELRGSTSVKVLIDGKPSGLVGLSSTDALRQLQGNLIERVEIITNPSARYDAEGMAGIINIILKKDTQKGVNGSFQANTGAPHNHGISFNVNLRRKWANLFTSYGLDYSRAPGTSTVYQRFVKPDTILVSDQTRRQSRGGIGHNIRFGSDFFLSPKGTLTASFLYRVGDELNKSSLDYFDFLNGELSRYTRRDDQENEIDKNLQYSLSYVRTFNKKDQKFTVDIQYQDNNEVERSDIDQTLINSGSVTTSSLFQKVRNDEGEKRWLFQADYVQPFATKGNIEAGYRSTLRDVTNEYLVRQKNDPSAPYVVNGDLTTDFSYDENVHALYTMVSNSWKKIDWQTGLRMEATDIFTEFREKGSTRQWRYPNWFPSAFLSYKFSVERQLQLSYSRRINRPRFREINPFTSLTDNRNLRVGNPELQPELTDSYELGLLSNHNKSSIYTGVYYRYTIQNIQRVTIANPDSLSTTRIPVNIGEAHFTGLEVNASHEFSKNYRINGNVNAFYFSNNGVYADSIDLSASSFALQSRLSGNIKFPKLFDAQININYRSPQNQPQGYRKALYGIDIGLSKDVWKGNGTLTLSARDLLNSRRFRYEIRSDDYFEDRNWQWRRGPQVVLTGVYRLNQRKSRQQRGERSGDFDDDGF